MKKITPVLVTALVLLLCGVTLPVFSAPSLNDTLLILASYSGDVSQMKDLIRQGANVNTLGSGGLRPIHFAVESGKPEAVQVLISHGALVNVQSETGNTPLIFAAQKGSKEIVEVLLRNNANVNIANNAGIFPLKTAIFSGNEEIVTLFTNRSALYADDRALEIGEKKYLFSVEAQFYLSISQESDYECNRKVLIIEEPHFSYAGQWSLYKGLDVFFQDNLTLIDETIFLVEGIEENKPLSVDPLIKTEPDPDEDLIQTVLDSFLITGYMAYEWKCQYGIPFAGIENKEYYDLSSVLWTKEKYSLWNLSVLARNKSMANVVIHQAGSFDNPILFVGGLHLQQINDKTYKNAQTIVDNDIDQEILTQLKSIKNQGIEDFLKEKKIGYTFMYACSNEDKETREKSIDRYRELFKAQLKNDYKEYINDFLETRQTNENGVTVKPIPGVAASFLAQMKSDGESGGEKDKDKNKNKDKDKTGKSEGTEDEQEGTAAQGEEGIQGEQEGTAAQGEQEGQEDQGKPKGKGPTEIGENGKEKPKGLPDGDWEWSPDERNGRGGKWINRGTKPHQEASWDDAPKGPRGKPGKPHWDVDDGKGNRIRYDEEGNVVTIPEAHPV